MVKAPTHIGIYVGWENLKWPGKAKELQNGISI
jgi:hypothetical protein